MVVHGVRGSARGVFGAAAFARGGVDCAQERENGKGHKAGHVRWANVALALPTALALHPGRQSAGLGPPMGTWLQRTVRREHIDEAPV